MRDVISRRRFLKTAVGGVLGLGLPAIGASAYVTRIEPYMLDVTRLILPLRGLPPAFAGTTIVQISDWHLGGWMAVERMMAIADVVNTLQPDIIAITGDFVTRIWAYTPGEITRILRSLQANERIVATLGNHDYWTHAPTVRAAIREAGVTLLDNATITLRRDGAALYLVGVDDIWEEHHDLDRALADVPDGAATVLLAHEPDFADEAAATGRIGLQLSGHSHGGQVRLPGKGALILPHLGRKYDSGLYRINGMMLYVNRGLGMVAPYVRFNCPPEVTHITLSAPEAA